jgi:uncharacterized membrane protein
MKAWLKHMWEALSSSLWFVPSVMTLVALGLALGSVALDDALPGSTEWAYGGGPEGAREVLGAIAASMITVAGVAFSITIVALTLASQQFGPRLLRNFMRDRGNQVVLGTFIATFTYCLIVLRTIRSSGTEFVPHISVTSAILLALASLGVLIYFIHHAAVSIQAPEVIALVANDLDHAINRLFPEKLGYPPEENDDQSAREIAKDFDQQADTIASMRSGYLQSIDNNQLMKIATENDLVLRLEHRPGDFVIKGNELVKVRPRGRANDELAGKITDAFILGTQRTHMQDVEFSVHQLVEVAVRALSPGVNDPFTAVTCIDRLGAALCLLAQRSIPSPFRFDAKHQLRVIARAVTFSGVVNAAFNQIRQYGRSSASVTIRLLEAITLIGKCTLKQEDRVALLQQAVMIERGSYEGLPEERDRQDIQRRFRKAVEALQGYS